jgi:signal transduction histidine kinase/ActR/RegA family two-component response regulator
VGLAFSGKKPYREKAAGRGLSATGFERNEPMNPLLREQRLEALYSLSGRLACESSGGLLGDSLDALQDSMRARAAAAFTLDPGLQSIAERGLGDRGGPELIVIRRALSTIAQRALSTRKPVLLGDLGRDREGIDDAGEILALGARTALAVPVLHRRVAYGVFVLLFDDAARVDSEAQQFATTIANMVAVALDRDQSHDAPLPSNDELAEASRMASLGLLTASVAHELRGPTGAMILQQEELARLVTQVTELADETDPEMSGAVREMSEVSTDIQTAVARIRDTVEQLSLVSRRETSPECVDLVTVVRESLAMATPHLERRGITVTQLLEGPVYTVGRRDSLGQVVLNLVFNAADACEGAAHPEVWVRVMARGEQLALVVDDNGPGVPPGAIQHIFRPFYTTKQRGQGTGLGLKICSDVVTSHGGHIEVHDRPGGGASFRVLLTRVQEDSGLIPLVPMRVHKPRMNAARARQVFLVDDDPVFARSMRRALRPHEVRTAGAASEAEAALLDPNYTPDLVLCDVFLPGRNGNTLHARIAARRPELAARFVFVTGGALGRTEAEYLKNCECPTLFKPVELKTLKDLLEVDEPESTPSASVRTLNASPSSANRRSSAPPSTRR